MGGTWFKPQAGLEHVKRELELKENGDTED